MAKKRKNQSFRAELLPSGSYRCRVYDSVAKKQRSFIAVTDTEAIEMARDWKLGHEIQKAAPDTLSDCIEKYIELESNILSPSTVDGYHRARNRLDEKLLKKPIARITAEDLQREVNRLAGKYSAKTVHNSFWLVSSVIRKYAPRTPMAVALPTIQKRIRELPTPAEVMSVFKGDPIELPVLLAMWLSLRKSEIRGLKKSDFKNGKVTINRVVITVKDGNTSKEVEKAAAKTKDSRRVIPVPSEIQAMVDQLEGDYITALSGQAIYKRFVRRMRAAGYEGVTFHDLRHINASVMLALGVPDKYAMERGGWSTPSTLKRVYQETYSTERERINTQIDDYFKAIYNTD